MDKDGLYICCGRCNEEQPESESMRGFERLSVSMNEDKTELLVWCNRHDLAVARIGVGGALQFIPVGLVEGRTRRYIERDGP